jgi:phosphoadenosine phosphosulfate reductase
VVSGAQGAGAGVMGPRAQQMHMRPLHQMVDEAVAFIREHEPPEGYLLADSFGKDSTVLLELTKMAGVKYLHIHNRTGIDPPELIRYGKRTRPEVLWIPPRMTMWEGIKKWFPPTVNRRWCCRVMKEHHVSGTPRDVLVGVRAEESAKRKQRPRIDHIGTLTKKATMLIQEIGKLKAAGANTVVLEAILCQSLGNSRYTHYKPIFYWLEWHVWEFIESLNLPYCELYDQGFNRIG